MHEGARGSSSIFQGVAVEAYGAALRAGWNNKTLL